MSSLWHDSLGCVLTALLPWVVSYHSKKKIIHLSDTQVVTKNVGIALLYMSFLFCIASCVSYSYKKKANCLTFNELDIHWNFSPWLSGSYNFFLFGKIKFQHLSTHWFSASYKRFKKLTAWLSAFCYSKYSPFVCPVEREEGQVAQPTADIVLSQIAYKSTNRKTSPIHWIRALSWERQKNDNSER
jgi:hypothetical protein